VSARGDRLIRLDGSGRIITREEAEGIARRVQSFARGGGKTTVTIASYWTGECRWGRNRMTLASDRRDIVVQVTRTTRWLESSATTNQLDDASLEATVRAAERSGRVFGGRELPGDLELPPPAFPYPTTAIWSDATYDLTTEMRGAVVRAVAERAEAKAMLSAGYLEVRGQSLALALPGRDLLHAACTQAQCSTTVRDAQGSGSGWAGLSSYDWKAIDATALAERALQKAITSRNPVGLEPGRYTVILEPQAVHDLIDALFGLPLNRAASEGGRGPFSLGPDPALGIGRSKLGLQVADARVTIGHDPADPQLGVLPFDSRGEPYRAVNWIERGVLTNLATDRDYALRKLNDNLGTPESFSFRMSGGEASLGEMIATTKRGLLVTRFSNISLLDPVSLLMTGITRDGLWLVENGKITKPVKNFRFTESPLFVLNSIEQLGVPEPVFRPGRDAEQVGVTPAIVPPLVVRDFSFTSLVDAV
jgi:predicted Zn-dependent protease